MRLFNRKPRQTTFVYCPICRNELAGSGSFVSDTRKGVTYKCSQCGCKSLWWFDDFIPFTLKYQHLEAKMTVSEHLKSAK